MSEILLWRLDPLDGILQLLLLVTALIVFRQQPPLDVAEVRLLEAGQLFKFSGPSGVQTHLCSSGTDDGAGYQVLVGVDELMVLEAQEDEEVDVLLDAADHSLFNFSLDRYSIDKVR